MGFLSEFYPVIHQVEHPMLVATLAVLVVVLSQAVYSTLRQYYRLHHIRGPPGAGLSKYWIIRAAWGPHTHMEYLEAAKRYGSIVRVGPRYLLTTDPDLWKHICATRSPYRRGDWYTAARLYPERDNILSTRDEVHHAKLRSKMSAGYSGRAVEGIEEKIDQNLVALQGLIESYASKEKPFDFGFKAQYFTLDAISNLAFGEPFGCLRTDSDMYEYIRTTEYTIHLSTVLTLLPWLVKLLHSRLFRWIFPSTDDNIGLGKIMGLANKVAGERFGPDKKAQRDMLGSFVANGLTQTELESEILVQILAGSDTTATAIRATFLHIITNPHVLSKLRAEIDSVHYDSAVIPDAVARTMPYLQAVIKEGLRTWPPVSAPQFKEVAPEGHTWKGIFLPGGTNIGFSWAMSMNEEIFGDDATEFRPERWLNQSVEKLKQMESGYEIIFSYGRSHCLGQSVAFMELNKIFVHLLTHFDMTVCNPAQPWKISNPSIFVIHEFWLRASRRQEK